MEPSKQINALLLVEDEESSLAIVKDAIEEFFQNPYQLKVFKDGQELVDFLNHKDKEAYSFGASVILLKVLSTAHDPLEFLRSLKANGRIKNHPLIVYSDSSDQDFVNACYDLHANSFVFRHPDDEMFRSSIKSLMNFWFTVVLPPETAKDY